MCFKLASSKGLATLTINLNKATMMLFCTKASK